MGLFDSRKEKKTILLAKKLQEEADKEWENERNKRREQELNDEAIAKALQAQLELEEGGNSNTATNPFQSSPPSFHTSSSSPPPLPVKPKEYNTVNRQSFSTTSLPTITTAANKTPSSSTTPLTALNKTTPSSITPLYSLPSSNSSGTYPNLLPRDDDKQKKPVKSYVSTQSYRPELRFNLSTPGPTHSSVFNEETPKITPNQIPSTNDIRHHDFYGQSSVNASTPIVMQPIKNNTVKQQAHISMPEPINTINYSTPIISSPTPPAFSPRRSDPVVLPLQHPPVIPIVPPTNTDNNQHNNPPPIFNHSNSFPSNTNPTYNNGYPNNGYTATTSGYSFNSNNTNYNSYSPSNYMSNGYPNNNNAAFSTTTNSQQVYSSPSRVTTNNTSLPLNPTDIVQNAATYPEKEAVIKPPISTTTSSSGLQLPPMPAFKSSTPAPSTLKSTNPYNNKMKYSNSVLSLKPDEDDKTATKGKEHSEDDDDDWDVVKPIHNRPPTPAKENTFDDDDSSYDYSDMIYSRKDGHHVTEEEDDDDWVDQAIDPFADNFTIEVAANATTATILAEETKIKEEKRPSVVTTLQPTIEILDPTLLTMRDEKTVEEKQMDATVVRQYEEKESNEIEVYTQPMFTPRPYPISTPQPPLIELDLPENKVYPTNVVKAGAPPKMSESNPYNSKNKQSHLKPVPATDYGYFKDGDKLNSKQLPELPPTTSEDDRHITVASINPGQKVWIRIHPTDTGRTLAERIGIVASYRTRRVTKITARSGRVISLNNSPIFEDWKEILNFQEGELWKIEWEPIDHSSSYVDIITEGKEFMKQLKANFKSSS